HPWLAGGEGADGMRLAEAARVAVGGLRANRLRSGLTMLGVITGAAAVVVLVAIGTGTRQEVERQVAGLGSNLLLISPGEASFAAAPTVSRLTLADAEAVARVVGDRERVAVQIASGETVRTGTNSRFTSVLGVLDTTPRVFPRELSRGSYLTRSDVDTARRVVVLGATVAAQRSG